MLKKTPQYEQLKEAMDLIRELKIPEHLQEKRSRTCCKALKRNLPPRRRRTKLAGTAAAGLTLAASVSTSRSTSPKAQWKRYRLYSIGREKMRI